MARRSEMVTRGWEGGPPAGWRVAARVLLVLGLVQLVGFGLAGGHFWPGPWLVLPLLFFWACAAPGLAGPAGPALPARGRTRAGTTSRRWTAGAGRPSSASTSLAAELAGTRRRLRELEEQLRWQARLLETAPPAPAPRAAEPPPPRPDAPAPPPA